MTLPKHLLNSIIACAVVFSAWSMPSFAFAEDTCACFCGTSKDGAEQIAPQNSTNTCALACSDADKTYVGCYTDESLYPKNNNLCWTQEECTTYPVKVNGESKMGKWGGQNAQCEKQTGGASMGYCYGPTIPVVLNVPILGETEIAGIGEYVDVVYRFSIPVVAIIAVFMFVLAGFQYMTAGGSKKGVTQAKERMQNAIVGIILLMSIYVIAYLIDPRLTRFQELRPPLIKEAVLIGDTTSCEALYAYGYCIDDSCPDPSGQDMGVTSKACGVKGTITGDEMVQDNIVNPPEVGDTCLYSDCDRGEVCLVKGDNSGGSCVTCDDVSSGNVSVDIQPSAAVCGQIAEKANAEDDNELHAYVCTYDDDFIGLDECVAFYTQSDSYINCDYLKDQAQRVSTGDGCQAYEQLNVKSYGLSNSAAGAFAEAFGTGSGDQVEDFKNNFASLCEQDICSIADAGKYPQGGCQFDDSNLIQDYFDGLTLGVFGLFDNYACIGKN